jgi:hypothetical protein
MAYAMVYKRFWQTWFHACTGNQSHTHMDMVAIWQTALDTYYIYIISIAKTNMGILSNDDLDGGFKYCLFQPNKW